MNARERLRGAMARKPVDRVPVALAGEEVGYTKPFLKCFREQTGAESPGEYFDLILDEAVSNCNNQCIAPKCGKSGAC